ncbi:UNVERIFIED_CONTAM: hypothetical protein FKN15_074757 [Acipenser sinensis]
MQPPKSYSVGGQRSSRVYYGRLTATTPALTREGEDEHTLFSEACAVKPIAFFYTADSPRSHPRATESEDNAALGQLTGKPAGARPDYRGRWCALDRRQSDSVSPVSYGLVKDITMNDSDGGVGVDESRAGDPLNEDRSVQEGPVTSAAHSVGLAWVEFGCGWVQLLVFSPLHGPVPVSRLFRHPFFPGLLLATVSDEVPRLSAPPADSLSHLSRVGSSRSHFISELWFAVTAFSVSPRMLH